jgi:ribosomal protein L32
MRAKERYTPSAINSRRARWPRKNCAAAINAPQQANKKCSLCGEYEALHHIGHQSGDAVKLYNSNLSAFWQL